MVKKTKKKPKKKILVKHKKVKRGKKAKGQLIKKIILMLKL